MLVRPTRSFPGTMFLFRGSAFAHVWPWLVIVGLWGTVIAVFQPWFKDHALTLSPTPLTILGVALSIFLGFRNNACYDRWWEARKLWGRLINTTRTFSRQVLALTDDPAAQKDLVYRMIGFAHALRLHLRQQLDRLDELKPFFPDDEVQRFKRESNVPTAILQGIADRLKPVGIEPVLMLAFDSTLTELSNIQGGCERIKNTPVPLSYTMLTHRIVTIYCIALPLGLVDTVGSLTPIAVLIISFAFLGLDSVGTQIEDPFEEDPNDLPLHAISRMIEVNLRQRLGESELPPMIGPKNGILL